MARTLLIALALGVLSAFAHAAVLLGGVGGLILALLASLPLFYAGLTAGPTAALVAAGTGTVASLALGIWPAVGFAIEVAAVPVLLTRRAVLFRTAADETVEWYPVGHLLGWLTGLGAAGLIAVHLWWALGSGPGLVAQLQGGLQAYLEELRRQGMFAQLQMAPGDLAALAAAMARFLPGVATAFWMMLMLGNGILAQGLALRFGKAIRPATPLSAMELPAWLALALAVSVGLAFTGGGFAEAGLGLSFAFAIPFFLQGCAVIHVAARRTPVPGLVLGFFYALIIVVGAVMMLVVLLGLFEQWIKLRRRLKGAGG